MINKNIIKLVDKQFAHGKSFGTGSLQISPNNFEWYRGDDNVNDFIVFSEDSFSLVDIQGKEVLNKQIKNASLIETVSLQGIAKGMYLAVVQTNNKRVTKKIIID